MCTWPSATGQSSRCGAKIGCVCAAACVVACVAAEETGASGCRRRLCGVERVMWPRQGVSEGLVCVPHFGSTILFVRCCMPAAFCMPRELQDGRSVLSEHPCRGRSTLAAQDVTLAAALLLILAAGRNSGRAVQTLWPRLRPWPVAAALTILWPRGSRYTCRLDDHAYGG